MGECHVCGGPLEFEVAFCPECGVATRRAGYCTQCGVSLETGARFCPECGWVVSDGTGGERPEKTDTLVRVRLTPGDEAPREGLDEVGRATAELSRETAVDDRSGVARAEYHTVDPAGNAEEAKTATARGKSQRSVAPASVAERSVAPASVAGPSTKRWRRRRTVIVAGAAAAAVLAALAVVLVTGSGSPAHHDSVPGKSLATAQVATLDGLGLQLSQEVAAYQQVVASLRSVAAHNSRQLASWNSQWKTRLAAYRRYLAAVEAYNSSPAAQGTPGHMTAPVYDSYGNLRSPGVYVPGTPGHKEAVPSRPVAPGRIVVSLAAQRKRLLVLAARGSALQAKLPTTGVDSSLSSVVASLASSSRGLLTQVSAAVVFLRTAVRHDPRRGDVLRPLPGLSDASASSALSRARQLLARAAAADGVPGSEYPGTRAAVRVHPSRCRGAAASSRLFDASVALTLHSLAVLSEEASLARCGLRAQSEFKSAHGDADTRPMRCGLTPLDRRARGRGSIAISEDVRVVPVQPKDGVRLGRLVHCVARSAASSGRSRPRFSTLRRLWPAVVVAAVALGLFAFAPVQAALADHLPIVVPGDSGFTKGGTASYWWSMGGLGVYGTAIYTYTNGSSPDNWGTWTFDLGNPAMAGLGEYDVSVYIPNNYATTKNAVYQINTAGGLVDRGVNQDVISNAWVDLGRYYFTEGSALVTLTDATGEAYASTMVGFDAVKLTYIDTVPPTATINGVPPSSWVNRAVTLTFSAGDNYNGSGVNRIEYRVDSGPWVVGSQVTVPAPVNHADDGKHTVSYYAVDNAGNAEVARSVTFGIDTAAPKPAALGVRTRDCHRGATIRLPYIVTDHTPGCGKAKVTIAFYRIPLRGTAVYVTQRHLGIKPTNRSYNYLFRCALAKGYYIYIFKATDIAGNASAVSLRPGNRVFLHISRQLIVS